MFYIGVTFAIYCKKITETRPKKHFKNEQRSKDAAAKKRPNTSGVGKINNYGCAEVWMTIWRVGGIYGCG